MSVLSARDAAVLVGVRAVHSRSSNKKHTFTVLGSRTALAQMRHTFTLLRNRTALAQTRNTLSHFSGTVPPWLKRHASCGKAGCTSFTHVLADSRIPRSTRPPTLDPPARPHSPHVCPSTRLLPGPPTSTRTAVLARSSRQKRTC
eukprot:343596-Chlamydomonas_euryale.AAC.2